MWINILLHNRSIALMLSSMLYERNDRGTIFYFFIFVLTFLTSEKRQTDSKERSLKSSIFGDPLAHLPSLLCSQD